MPCSWTWVNKDSLILKYDILFPTEYNNTPGSPKVIHKNIKNRHEHYRLLKIEKDLVFYKITGTICVHSQIRNKEFIHVQSRVLEHVCRTIWT